MEKKDKSWPGFYFQFSNDKVLIVGGSYVLENDQLLKLRKYIAGHLKEFTAAYNQDLFKEKFGEIQGEKNKKLPEEFKAVAEKEPLIANKQFYYETELKPQILTVDNLEEVLMEFYLAGKKVNDFLKKGLK